MSDSVVPALQGATLREVVLPCGCGCQATPTWEPVIVRDAGPGALGSAPATELAPYPPPSDVAAGEDAQGRALPSLVPI